MGPNSVFVISVLVIIVSVAIVAYVIQVLKREEKETKAGVSEYSSQGAKEVHLLPKSVDKAFDEATRDSGTNFPPKNRPAHT